MAEQMTADKMANLIMEKLCDLKVDKNNVFNDARCFDPNRFRAQYFFKDDGEMYESGINLLVNRGWLEMTSKGLCNLTDEGIKNL